jgi:tRNA splicing endonuclease
VVLVRVAAVDLVLRPLVLNAVVPGRGLSFGFQFVTDIKSANKTHHSLYCVLTFKSKL